MFIKSSVKLLAFLCFTKSFYTQGYKKMSNFAGIYSIVYVTVPPGEVGKNLAHGLIEKKLAACVNIIPKITSIYRWENATVEDEENLLMIKTRTDTVNELTTYVKATHPYKVCEVISVPIQNGNENYFQFIDETVPPIEMRETDKKKN